MSRSVLTGYMGRNYTHGNIVVAATGKLRHEDVLAQVGKHFGDLPATMPPGFTDGRYHGGEYREERDLDQVHVVLGFPSVGYGDPDYYPTLLLSTLLGGGMSSRLFQEIREKRGLVYSIYSFTAPFKDGGLFGIYAGTGESEAAELMPVMLAELGKVQVAVTAQELARARAQLKASLLMSQESTGSRCEQLARQIQTYGRVISTEETIGRINGVTEADIRRAAARHFRAAPTLATVGPSAQVPGLADIVETLGA
jgi:predicted Zn-dependent peptidase